MHTDSKKLLIVFIFVVLLPLSLVFLVEITLKGLDIRWEVRSLNNFRFVCLITSAAASLYIICQNKIKALNSIFWYVLGGLFIIMSIGFFYAIYSLSHFGF